MAADSFSVPLEAGIGIDARFVREKKFIEDAAGPAAAAAAKVMIAAATEAFILTIGSVRCLVLEAESKKNEAIVMRRAKCRREDGDGENEKLKDCCWLGGECRLEVRLPLPLIPSFPPHQHSRTRSKLSLRRHACSKPHRLIVRSALPGPRESERATRHMHEKNCGNSRTRLTNPVCRQCNHSV